MQAFYELTSGNASTSDLLRFQIGFVWRFLGRRHVVREALPDTIALSRLACRVRTVIRRILSDTLRIASHDRTGSSPCHRLAALSFIAATHPHLALLISHLEFAFRHLAFVICHLPSAICHLASAICHLPSAICHLPSAIRRPSPGIRPPPSGIRHLPFGICHPPFPHSAFFAACPAFAAALGAGPTGTAGAARTPGCNSRRNGRSRSARCSTPCLTAIVQLSRGTLRHSD